VEIGTEAGGKNNGAHAPIGAPSVSGRGRKLSVQHESVEITERTRTPMAPNGMVVPALPVTGTLRPPPGLSFPGIGSGGGGGNVQSHMNGASMNGSKYFPSVAPVVSLPDSVSQGNEKHTRVPETDIISMLRCPQGDFPGK